VGVIGEGVDLLKLVDKGVNADLYKQLGEWIDKVGNLQREVEECRAKNLQLEERLRFKGKIQKIAGHTYVEGDDEEICVRCAAVDLRPVPLVDMDIDGRGRRATCPQCKTARGVGPPIPKKRAEETARRLADKTA
jgi:NAD-dependent dihydropyrimidine dehydrogenase PreA subunit